MKKSFLIVLFTFSFVLFLSACGEESTSSPDETNDQLKINTTVYPLQFFVQQIAGEAAEVGSILPPGADPHTYEPTTKEMVKMAESDAFIYSSAELEGYAGKIADSINPEGVTILEASQGIDEDETLHHHGTEQEKVEEGAHKEEQGSQQEHNHEQSHGHDHGGQDPHIWLDPLRSVQLAENIKQVLIELAPEKREQFNENFNQLKEELQLLDQKFHEQIENKTKKEIIVSHAAYGTWEEAYGIEQIAVSGLSPTNEPSQKELEAIIELANEHNLNYVLFEQNITPKVAQVVQKEIGAEALRLHNLSVRTKEDVQANEDYFSLMEHNLEILSKALSD